MFEDIKKEPEDILAGTDKGTPPPSLPVERPAPLQVGAKFSAETEMALPQPLSVPEIAGPRKFWKKFFIAFAVVIVASGGILGYVLIRNNSAKPAEVKTTTPAAEEQTVVPPVEEEVIPEQEAVTPQAPVDSDGDGLIDEEETVLGTNPNNPDSDGDGLNDKEEVKVYLTDPLDPDTDKDSYPDGSEVKNGYDPKGPGKLFTVPAP